VNELLQTLRDCRDTLVKPVGDSIETARLQGRRQWFSIRWRIAPQDLLPGFMEARTEDSFFWQEPSHDIAIVGIGRAAALEALGHDRFNIVAGSARDLFSNLQLHDLDPDHVLEAEAAWADARGPLLMGGFAFYGKETEGEIDLAIRSESEWRGLGAGRMILPELCVVSSGSHAWVTRTCPVEPDDESGEILERLCAGIPGMASGTSSDILADPGLTETAAAEEQEGSGPEIRVQADRAHARYVAQVEAALEAIDAGEFEKVVLARSLKVEAGQDFDLGSFLASLREIYPTCATLVVRKADHWFISATPELLVALDGDEVTTAALAGSAPRGRNPREEEEYSRQLFGSDKERVEHDVVKSSICAALATVCGSLECPDEPRLLKLEGIQHLETPLRGRLLSQSRGNVGILDLVAALHPTPAVGGAPSGPAVKWLEQHEALERGWFAGPVGYLDAQGNGEFRVALRCALVRGKSARLFAGAGIVAGSEPQRELAETRLKLRAVLAPLTEI